MNRIYKKVWSKTRGCFIAVSEVMTSTGKGSVKVVVGLSCALLFASATNATMSTNYRKNIPAGPFTSKVTAVEGDYSLNWSDNTVVEASGGIYTFIYGGRNIHSNIRNLTNNGQVYLGAWENGGVYTLTGSTITNNQNALFHIGNYAQKAEANGFNRTPLHEEKVQTAQPEAFELSSGTIQNNGAFFNCIETRIQGGSVANNGSWTNDSSINQSGGSFTGTGTVTTNGTYNLTSGTFNNKLNGDGRFVYAGGSFYSPQISGDVTLQVNSGLSASVGTASGGKLENSGTFTLNSGTLTIANNKAGGTLAFNSSSTINSLQNAGVVNANNVKFKAVTNSGTVNATGTITFDGTFTNTGTLNAELPWQFGSGRLNSSGTVKTKSQNIFDSLGTTGAQDLHFVSLNSKTEQEVKTSLNNFFQKYVKGSVAKNLINHASFSGGKVIISGVNITKTQALDLEKEFKSKIYSLFPA